ncbi:serine hydrolase [Mucilaginibacter mali]|uniref:Serine hydrolase n=1 Tax=Mucilaginibacter mali TaxID=2740462 RepID=A0A7D4Q3S7_9SPHI|nr:serine hydrolase [Mucilaginibacter mali]QKJ30507.1 serine hydrolase [Mucilaginibacter mali]
MFKSPMRFQLVRIFFFAVFIFLARHGMAQESITISGKIRSSENQQTLHGVNVGIDKKGVGTATNNSGNYVLIIPSANFKDSLKVSCIGYRTQTFAVASLRNGQELNISLQKNSVQLKQVTVAYYDPAKVIAKAIARIPDNYINHPHILRGFYRMYTTKGTEPLELSEAVFDVYNFGYADKRADLFKLIKARDEKNQRDFHSLELSQQPNTIFNYDVVNHIVASGFLSEEGLIRHKFEVTGVVDVKGYQALEVVFKEKKADDDEPTFRGKFYVDLKSYAFIYFDYGLSPGGLTNELGKFSSRILTRVAGVNADLKQYHTKVGYQKVGSKWVLSDVVGDDALGITSKDLNYDFNANVKFNYQVTAVDTNRNAAFDTKFGRHENINDHNSNTGESFWKDYNVLLPDYNAEDIFKYIQSVNKQTTLKDKFEEKMRKSPGDSSQRLETLLKFYNDNGQFNGTALIRNQDRVVLSKSYGYAEKKNHMEGNSHTAYDLGTGSGIFTSFIINQLINEGKIDAGAAIKTYMPYYKFGDVTVQQLLTHQSGIPDYAANDDYMQLINTKPYTLKDMVVNFCSDSLATDSTGVKGYSRSNFVILSLMAQEVAGKPFADLLKERIFTPLEMTDTYLGNASGININHATGYNGDTQVALPFDVANQQGAAGVSSSAEDLLKFHNALLSNKLLPNAQKLEMLKPRADYEDHGGQYAYGWVVDKNAFDITQKQRTIAYATGDSPGIYSMFIRDEATGNCIILLNNTGNFPRYDMADLLLNVLK